MRVGSAHWHRHVSWMDGRSSEAVFRRVVNKNKKQSLNTKALIKLYTKDQLEIFCVFTNNEEMD